MIYKTFGFAWFIVEKISEHHDKCVELRKEVIHKGCAFLSDKLNNIEKKWA